MKLKVFRFSFVTAVYLCFFVAFAGVFNVEKAFGGSGTTEIDVWIASELGDTAAIAMCLSKSVDVNARDRLGKTPLMRSVAFGKLDGTRFLLDSSAEVDLTDKLFGETAIHLAARFGHLDSVKLLVERGADPKRRNGYGLDALAISVAHGNISIAEYFLDTLKMSPDGIVDQREGDTLLMRAAKLGLYDMVNSLLARGADKSLKSRAGMKAADYASSSHSEEVLDLLKEKGEKLYDRTKAASLVYASFGGYVKGIKDTIADGADPNCVYMVRGGQLTDFSIDALAHLIGEMINTGIVTTESLTPLTVAAAKGKLDAARCLVKNGAKPDFVVEKGCHTPLMVAINFGNFDVAKFLVESGADVNAKSARGDTPLILAVHMRAAELVGMLLEKGADINAANASGITPATRALESCDMKIIELLKARGLDIKKAVKTTDSNRGGPLGAAIDLENAEMVKFFIDIGVSVNVNSLFSMKPLAQSVERNRGFYTIAKLLIDAGARVMEDDGRSDRSYTNGRARTPLMTAAESDFVEIVKLLIERGERIDWKYLGGVLANSKSARTAKFFTELGLRPTAEVPEEPWNLPGFPYELGRRIAAELKASDGSSWRRERSGPEKTDRENIDLKNRSGLTALGHIMRYNDYERVARMLVEAGANVNVGDRWGTPLTCSIDKSNIGFCEYLISKGANVNLSIDGGARPLISAIKSGNRKFFDILVKNGADAPFDTNEILAAIERGTSSGSGSGSRERLEMIGEFAKIKGVSIDRENVFIKNVISSSTGLDIKYYRDNKLYGMDRVSTAEVELYSKNGSHDIGIKLAGAIGMRPDEYLKLPGAMKESGEAAMIALRCGNADFMKYFYSVSSSSIEFDRRTALITACMQSGNPDLVEFGMNKMEEADTQHIYGQCSMAHGVDSSVATLLANGRIGAVKQFIAKHPEMKNRYFSSSLIYRALIRKDFETLKYILDNIDDADRNFDENIKIMEWIISNNDEKIIKRLKEAGFDPAGEHGADLLNSYVRTGKVEAFKKLFESGIGSNYFKQNGLDNLLHIAVSKGDVGIAGYLVGKGADVKGKDYVGEALGRGDSKMADYLVSLGASYKSLETALNYAIENEDYAMIDFVFSKKVDTDYKSYEGTPALAAVKKGNVALMEKLISKGISLKSPFSDKNDSFRAGANEMFDASGMHPRRKVAERSTLLNFAIDAKNPEMASLLALHADDVNQAGSNGKCAVELAVENNFTDVALAVIGRKDFNVSSPGAEKALRTAVWNENAPVIKALMERGVKYTELETAEKIKTAVKKDGHGSALAAVIALTSKKASGAEIVKKLMDSGIGSDEVLFDAVRGRCAWLVDHCLNAGIRPEYTHYDKRTPLVVAVENGDADIVRKLLAAGADARKYDPYMRPLVLLACQKRNFDIVKLLVEKGADPGATTPFGLTAPYAAYRLGEKTIVEYFKSRKVSFAGALISAIIEKDKAGVEYFLELGADPNVPVDGDYPLAAARRVGNDSIIASLKAGGANDNYEKAAAERKALFEKVSNMNSEHALQSIIESIPDVNISGADGKSLLECLISRHSVGAARALVDRGADLDRLASDGTPLFMKLPGIGIPLDEKLIGRIKNIAVRDSDGRNAMFFCGVEKSRGIFTELKKRGLDPNATDYNGLTPLLFHASKPNSLETIKALVEAGADFRAKTSDGRNAMMLAVNTEYSNPSAVAVIKYLSDLGLGIDDVDSAGNTLLHLACTRDHVSAVNFIISRGAAINAKNAKGQTPLTSVIESSYISSLPEILLKAGAVLEKDPNGKITSEGIRDLIKSRNVRALRMLIDKNLDAFPELNEESFRTFAEGGIENGIFVFLQIAGKRKLAPDKIWKIVFEKIYRIEHDRNEHARNEIARMLLECGYYDLIKYAASTGLKFDYNNKHRDDAHAAARKGNTDALKFLFETNASKYDSKRVIGYLREAIDSGGDEASLFLLERLAGCTEEVETKNFLIDRFVSIASAESLEKLIEREKTDGARNQLKRKIMRNAFDRFEPEAYLEALKKIGMDKDSEAVEIMRLKKMRSGEVH